MKNFNLKGIVTALVSLLARLLFLINLVVIFLLNAKSMEKAPNVEATATAIFIEASVEKVWAVLAEDFAGIGKWSSGVSHSQGFGNPIGDSPYSIRACEITAAGFDDTKEEILQIDSDSYLLRYSLFDGLPGFVKDAENVWKLESRDGGTYVSARTEMKATGIMGFAMKGMMKGATRKALESMTEEIKYYIEKGEPHPNKVASEEKIASKDAKLRKKVVSFEVTQEIDAPVELVWKVIGEDFGNVYKSNPLSTYSKYLDGFETPGLDAKRIMYMSENKKQYFVDKISKWVPNKHLTIEVDEKAGFPIRPGYTWVNFDLETINSDKTQLKLRFNYLTKPNFLKGMAKSSLKKNFQEYAWAIDYHVRTGEVINKENWKTIRKNYKQ